MTVLVALYDRWLYIGSGFVRGRHQDLRPSTLIPTHISPASTTTSRVSHPFPTTSAFPRTTSRRTHRELTFSHLVITQPKAPWKPFDYSPQFRPITYLPVQL
ncbi:hypothetical protein BC835DRAFT_448948 [Cytidiella melzeri]|nr:hypothetical protein BC835DRAFT_448948 [Cytidiella melzeri]